MCYARGTKAYHIVFPLDVRTLYPGSKGMLWTNDTDINAAAPILWVSPVRSFTGEPRRSSSRNYNKTSQPLNGHRF
jgi:hypothetical protein